MPRLLDGFKINMSHQEMDRLVEEMDNLWKAFTMSDDGPTGVEWLPVAGIAHALYQDLGYEDMDEFEDALNGTFYEFLGAMPHVKLRSTDEGKHYFQLVAEPPQEEWVPTRMTFKVESTKDLWRVCLKSPHATVEIPELEFEISADGKKRIDSLYNHIAQAVFNLGNHVQGMRASMSSVHAMRIMETVEELNKLLDVEKPWTWIVHDPSGMSEFKPDDGVTVETGVTREQGDEQQQGQQPAAAGDTTAAVPTAADASAAQQQLESLD